jgi:ankyrin repeat protein
LLRYGANPDLRDEDGKTPLDKARERSDEGHREVIQILQSPGMACYILLFLIMQQLFSGRDFVENYLLQPVARFQALILHEPCYLFGWF